MNEKQQCQNLNGAITKIEGLEGKLANLINQCTSDIFVDSGNNIEILKMKILVRNNYEIFGRIIATLH